MAEPGRMVVRGSGALGVLPSGAFAVFNSAGGCPSCCGDQTDVSAFTILARTCGTPLFSFTESLASAQMPGSMLTIDWTHTRTRSESGSAGGAWQDALDYAPSWSWQAEVTGRWTFVVFFALRAIPAAWDGSKWRADTPTGGTFFVEASAVPTTAEVDTAIGAPIGQRAAAFHLFARPSDADASDPDPWFRLLQVEMRRTAGDDFVSADATGTDIRGDPAGDSFFVSVANPMNLGGEPLALGAINAQHAGDPDRPGLVTLSGTLEVIASPLVNALTTPPFDPAAPPSSCFSGEEDVATGQSIVQHADTTWTRTRTGTQSYTGQPGAASGEQTSTRNIVETVDDTLAAQQQGIAGDELTIDERNTDAVTATATAGSSPLMNHPSYPQGGPAIGVG